MANSDIQGTITDADGNPVSNATVYVWEEDSPNKAAVATTDSNGDYIFNGHPDGDGTSREWHVSAYYTDGSGNVVNTLSKPRISASLGSAIPDSVVQQFDPRERSTGTITTMQDKLGLANLSGECDVISSGINGNQSYRFDGSSSNEMLHSTTITTSDPFAVVFVIEQQTAQGSNTSYFDGGTQNEFGVDEDEGSGVDKLLRGGDVVSEPDFLDPQTPHVISAEALNGSDIKVRLDGSKIATKSASASDFTGLKIGGRRGRSDLNVQADFGQIEVLAEHTQSDLESVEQRLADNYGIALS